jgi:hypothetical protein
MKKFNIYVFGKKCDYIQYPGFFLHISSFIPAKLIKYFDNSLYIVKPSPFSHFPLNMYESWII